MGIQSVVNFDASGTASDIRILLSAEEDKLSPLNSNIACLCWSRKINNYNMDSRQRQVPKPNGSEVKWAECPLIKPTELIEDQAKNLNLDSPVPMMSEHSAPADGSGAVWISRLESWLSAEEDMLSPLDSNFDCSVHRASDIRIYKETSCIPLLKARIPTWKSQRHLNRQAELECPLIKSTELSRIKLKT